MCKHRPFETDNTVTVDTGIMRAWGVVPVEDHSSVKLLEWSLFLVHTDDSEVNPQQ